MTSMQARGCRRRRCEQPCGPVFSLAFWADVSIFMHLAWGSLGAEHVAEAVLAVAMQCISSYTSYKALKACTLVITAALGSGSRSVLSAAAGCIAWYLGTGILLSLAAFLGERQALHWRKSAATALHAAYGHQGALYKVALVQPNKPADVLASGTCSSCTSSAAPPRGVDNVDQRMTADLNQCCQVSAQLLCGMYTNPYAASGTLVSMALSLRDVGASAPTALLLCAAWALLCCVCMSLLDGWVAARTAAASASSGHLRYGVARALRQAGEVFALRGGTAQTSRIHRILAHNITQRVWQYVAELAQACWYGFQAAYPAVMALAVVAFTAWRGDIAPAPPQPGANFTAVLITRAQHHLFRVPDQSVTAASGSNGALSVQAVGLAAAAVMTLMYALTSIPGLLDSLGALAGRLSRVAELHRALKGVQGGSDTAANSEHASEQTALLQNPHDASAQQVVPSALSTDQLLRVDGLQLLCPVSADSNPTAAPRQSLAHVPPRVLCSNVNLTLTKGRRVLVQGPTGSGKSTLVRTVLGLHSSSESCSQPHAAPPRSSSACDSITWRPGVKVFVVPQHPFIPLRCSLRELLMFPSGPAEHGARNTEGQLLHPPLRPHTDSDLVHLLLWMRLEHLLHDEAAAAIEPPSTWLRTLQQAAGAPTAAWKHVGAPHSAALSRCLDAPGADWHLVLSPGEAQRIAAIRLLLHAPHVAVLDEATSALDDAMQGRVMDAVVGTGAAVLSVGHRGSLARWHDTVLQLTPQGLLHVERSEKEHSVSGAEVGEIAVPEQDPVRPTWTGGSELVSAAPQSSPKRVPGGCCVFLEHMRVLLLVGFPRFKDPITLLGVGVAGVAVALAWLTVRSALKYADVYAAVVAGDWRSVVRALLWASAVYVGAAVAGAAARFLGKLMAVLWYRRLVARLTALLFADAAVLRLAQHDDSNPDSTHTFGRNVSLNALEMGPLRGGAQALEGGSGRADGGVQESITAPLIPHTPAVAMGPIARGAAGSSHGGGARGYARGGGARAGGLDQRLLADAYSATHQIGLLLFGAENRIALLTVLATIGTSTAAAAALSPWAVQAAWAFGAAATAVSLVAVRRIPAAVYALRSAEGTLRQQHSHLRAASASVALSGGGAAAAASLDAALARVVRRGMSLATTRLPAVMWERAVALGGTGVAYGLTAAAWETGRVAHASGGSSVTSVFLLAGLLTSLLLYLCALPDYLTLSADAAGLVSRVGELLGWLQGGQAGVSEACSQGKSHSSADGDTLMACIGLGVAPCPGAAPLLSNVNLTLAKGRRVLVQGPTGSGKSTLVRTVAGATPPTHGYIQWKGGAPRYGFNGTMVLAQAPVMFHGTLEELLLFPTPPVHAKHPLTAAANLAGFAPIPGAHMPDAQRMVQLLRQFDLLQACARACGCAEGGLDAAEGGLQLEADWHLVLSPGEAQRIAAIRLLLHAPHVAVLDEATSALDDAMQGRVMDAVVGTGAAVLSVGHRGSLARWHDTVLNTQQWQ